MDHVITKIMSKNDFPSYNDGDVLIIISPDQQYTLHAATLRNSSGFFRDELTEENAVQLAPKAKKNGIHIRWRLELDLPEDVSGTEVGELIRRDLDVHARPLGRNLAQPFLAAKETPLLYTHYDNLLRCLFHQPPKFASADFALALRDVVGLTDIAESLSAMPAVSSSLDVALLNQGEVLFRSVASNPAAWADLACRIRSEILCRESVVHLVGQWGRITTPSAALGTAAGGAAGSTTTSGSEADINSNGDAATANMTGEAKKDTISNLHNSRILGLTPSGADIIRTMRPSLLKLVTTKAAALDEKKKAIELRLLGHYPPSLQVLQHATQNVGAGSRTVRGKGAPTRAKAYSDNVVGWMALNLFRHWLGQSIAGEMSRRAADGGLAFYTAIRDGDEHYVDQHAREAFCRHFPLSAKARTNFDRAVWEVKETVKGYVSEVVGDRESRGGKVRGCMLDTERFPVQWLVCTGVETGEMPWVVEEREVEGRKSIFGTDVGVEREERVRDEMMREEERESRRKRKNAGASDATGTGAMQDAGAMEGWEMIEKRQKREDRARAKRMKDAEAMDTDDDGEGGAGDVDLDAGKKKSGAARDDDNDESSEDDRWGSNAFTAKKRKMNAGTAQSSHVIPDDDSDVDAAPAIARDEDPAVLAARPSQNPSTSNFEMLFAGEGAGGADEGRGAFGSRGFADVAANDMKAMMGGEEDLED